MNRGATILMLALTALIIWGAAHIARSLAGVDCLQDRIECRYEWEKGARVKTCMEKEL